MANCEFEEKEFEAPLYRELASTNGQVWAPGLVLERYLGIDYSIHCAEPALWSLHGFVSHPIGVSLEKIKALLGVSRPLPNFALNLFLQAKRPTHSTRAPKKLQKQGLSAPYWRFGITPHQQERLEALACACGDDALVCYSAPAFHRLLQLYANTVASSVVSNTSFPQVDLLKGHKAWNYSCSGTAGVANVDPVRYEVPLLEEQIRQLVRSRSEQLRRDSLEALEDLARKLRDSVQMSGAEDDGRAAVFHLRAREIEAAFDGAPDIRDVVFLKNYAHVANYAATFNVLWLTIGAGG
jgi:hypothetical protein